jgi:hypothetical protein
VQVLLGRSSCVAGRAVVRWLVVVEDDDGGERVEAST